MQKKLLIPAVAAMLLSACTPPPPYAYSPHPLAQASQPANTPAWLIDGSMSIQVREKTQMGTFNWKQIGSRYAINFYGPLNIGVIGIAGQPGRVTLNKGMGRFSAASPEMLMQQQLGWHLPVSNLYYWVRGISSPGSIKRLKRDNRGHLIYLQQQGWAIHFAEFQPQPHKDFPRKIWLENRSLRVKLAIHNEQIAE